MGCACGAYGWGEGVCRVLVGKPEGKRPLGRPRRRWVDNIRMDHQEVGCGYMDWIGVAQDRDRWRTLVSMSFLIYSACKSHLFSAVVYRHLWPVRLYRGLTLSIRTERFSGETLLDMKVCVLISFTTSVWNISHSKKNSASYYHECT